MIPTPSITPVRFRCDRVYHGGDYNPDQWPEAIWDEDMRLMREAGVSLATLPVFGWQALNPSEGVFTFDWLDRIIDRLDSAGIDLCLATATAATPAWLDEKYPSALVTDEHGRVRPHGNRHSFCPHSPDHRRLAADLVRALATRYGRHPRLKLWHIGNEYGGSRSPYCHCPRCAAAFRDWLRARHGSLASLNAHWSTGVWGHAYGDWSQVEPPFAHGEMSIPAHRIDWRRFHTEALLGSYLREVAIVRELTPGVPVTTNFMGAFGPLDYRVWAPHLDVISWDSYPMPEDPPAAVAFRHALMRGLRPGEPFLLMEQSPSGVNWASHCRLRPPGELRQHSFQALAHGADAVLYFQWRQSPGGIEKYHGSVLEHHGRSGSRVFREVAALGAELAALGSATVGGRIRARVAVIFDWASWWAFSVTSGPRRDLDYPAAVQPYYTALHAAGIAAEVIGLDADFAPYDVIIAPWTTMLTTGQALRIEHRVRAGATFIATHFTARVDEHDRIHSGGAPGPLRDLLGLTVEEFDAPPGEGVQRVRFEEALADTLPAGSDVACGFLNERLWLATARPLARYTADFYAGEPAITENAFGAGRSLYLATKLEDRALGALLRAFCARHGIVSPLRNGAPPPGGVEVAVRVSPEGSPLLYLINHMPEDRVVPLPAGEYHDLLTGAVVHEETGLAPRGVRILQLVAEAESRVFAH
ncbi:MAG: Beta-galactosidase [Rariglobus sp.]|jgi:beta-galactosidase|nr:Beta-galactosidase [Rariglobus sp.]